MLIKKGQKVKIISDLHLYSDFQYSSFFYNDEEFLVQVKKLSTEADLVIFNGDVFETWISFKFPTPSRKIEEVRKQVYVTYRKTFEYIFHNKEKFVFTVGNHDGVLINPAHRAKIFGKDLDKIRFRRAEILEFEPKTSSDNIKRAIVAHGDEPFYTSDKLWHKLVRFSIDTLFWAATNILSRSQVLMDPSITYKKSHKGDIFDVKNIKSIEHHFNYEKIDIVVLGHTHNAVMTPLVVGRGPEARKYTYVNTGFYCGVFDYVTTLTNDDGEVKIHQEYTYNEEKEPEISKAKTWLYFPAWVEGIVRKYI